MYLDKPLLLEQAFCFATERSFVSVSPEDHGQFYNVYSWLILRRHKLWLIFILFPLKSFYSLQYGGKCVSSKFRDIFPTLVTTNLRKGGFSYFS